MLSCLYESNGGTIIGMDDPTIKKVDDSTPLTYEETPVIQPVGGHGGEVEQSKEMNEEVDDPSSVIPEATNVFGQRPVKEDSVFESNDSSASISSVSSVPVSKHPKKIHFGTILFIALLFGLGVWLSSQLRSFFAPVVRDETSIPAPSQLNGLPSNSVLMASPSATGAMKTMEIVSGATKKPIEGISFQLPSSVKDPVCDSTRCASYGTYLPGGTRFTIAVRGKGQLLPDFRGAILTDAAGREFVMKQTMIGTLYVYEYIGDFTGRTGGGYTFTKMRGALVPVSETLAIDFNHFATAGMITDFVSDDKLFDDIIKSFKGSAPVATITPTVKPTVKPTVSLPSSTPIATSTGF